MVDLQKEPHQPSCEGILISDFDGTMTRYDFYDLVCKEFPDILTAGFWQQYEQGKITHFQALRLIFASIRSDEARLYKIVESMELSFNLAQDIGRLKKAGWEVLVVSAGCGWYIDHLFKKHGVFLPVYANPGTFSEQEGLQMRLPEKSPFFSFDVGIDKAAVVRDALQRSTRVAFAGDGRPDLAPALLVPARLRFAKSWLAEKLQKLGESFQPFEHWQEIADILVKGANKC